MVSGETRSAPITNEVKGTNTEKYKHEKLHYIAIYVSLNYTIYLISI